MSSSPKRNQSSHDLKRSIVKPKEKSEDFKKLEERIRRLGTIQK